MSDEKTDTPTETEAANDDAPTVKVADEDTAVAAGAGKAPTETAAEPAAEPQTAEAAPSADVERLEAEKADLTDRLLRLAAEMENLRRRTERDLAEARKYSVQRFAGDMLVVRDNLRRALEAVPAEARESGDEAFRALLEGVEMTSREMDRLLERNGITRIAAQGEPFDPNRHEAMFEVPDASVPAGTVVQVVQDGYRIGDRVLRAALVGVSKEAPKAEEGDGASAPEGATDVEQSAGEDSPAYHNPA